MTCQNNDEARAAQSGEWAMVPREPTLEMLDAGETSLGITGAHNVMASDVYSCYRAMLAAAPPAPAAEPVAWTEDAEKWGDALNDAAWTFIEHCPEKSALLFNNTKAPLRAAILKYAELVKKAAPPPVEASQQSDSGDDPGDALIDEIDRLRAELEDAQQSRDWHARRCDLLQHWQSKMRDPERTIVCDILANGATLPDPSGTRYGIPEASQQQAKERKDDPR